MLDNCVTVWDSNPTPTERVSSMQYTIPARSLAIVAPGMAKRDVRYYLNGVQVRDDICTATDGHMLLRAKSPAQVAPAPLLLPREAVEWALKASKSESSGAVSRGDGRALTC